MGLFKNLLGTTLNSFKIGKGTPGDKTLVANTGSATPPVVNYNDTTKLWEVSDNGTDLGNIFEVIPQNRPT